MGVNSLWDIVGPTARPVRLEALSRKKLAVDASIWIYQFLKAVRDSEGNSLPQSHIVGFFRRICKLLYFGIFPIFVFDGGAPALKRETINQRRERRQGQAETTRQTAQKLLAIQIQREAEKLRNVANGKHVNYDAEDDVIYLEDLPINHPQHGATVGNQPVKSREGTPSSQTNVFRKADEYHLPELKQFKVSRDDGRIMPEEEFLEENIDHIDGVDINTVDPNSKEFLLLPKATQYMILSHLRLRSRLRMGYRKEQLEELFPNSMDFSKFQIKQVQKRNFYTQKLMKIAGMGEDGNMTKRIAGDKDRKYALVRNEDGWTLALQGEESTASNPIVLDENVEDIASTIRDEPKPEIAVIEDEVVKVEEQSDSEFEDVPFESEEVKTENIDSEDDDLQNALIESIYEKFESRPSEIKSITSDGFDEEELSKAIEFSRKDLQQLQQQEKEIERGSANTSSTHTFATTQDRQLMPSESEFSFGESLLFVNSESSKINEQNLELDLGSSILFTGSDKRETPIANVHTTEAKSQNEAKEREKEKVDSTEAATDKKSDKIVDEPRQLPSWFSAESSSNPHSQPFMTYSSQNTSKKYKDDEEAGLISWNEAKTYLDAEEINDVLEESEGDIQEISAPATEIPESITQQTVLEVPSNKENVNEERRVEVLDYDFEQEEEEELVEQLQKEEAAHESFRENIKKIHQIPVGSTSTSISEEQLLQEQLQKSKRDSDEVTQNMITDVQELLRRFGIPYITAPMEAEAQCAELVKIGLVDGIITDDSDCFLFGGTKVYKNMFNQKQYVECYSQDDVVDKIGLTRKNLIELALLLGSDYTEGIKGIGPVLAMEILAEFGSLKNFKKWFDEKTKTVKSDKKDQTALEKNLLGRIRNGKLFLPERFPDSVVFDAYEHPEVDHDRSEFKWGVPNLDQIRSFLMYNLRWTQDKVDEVMIPLIRDMNRKRTEGTQSTIGEFFPQEYIQSRKEVKLGKRMKSAANKLNKRQKKGT